MKKNLFIVMLIIVAVGIVSYVAFASDQMRTTNTLIYSSETAVSIAVNPSFTLYIGDNLSGITNPVKSLYFVASGVYTGNGTINFKIDSDAGTSQTFTLPNVGTTPTPFELIYKDPSNKINPTSGGSYGYTLNMTPSGVILYGLGVKMSETHRYVPPSCTGMPIKGELTSAVFDSGITDGAAYNSVMWKGSVEGTGKVRFQLATSNCENGATNDPTCSIGIWQFVGGSTCGSGDWYDTLTSGSGGGPGKPVELTCAAVNHNNKRYYRYKIQICSNTDCSSVGATSPEVSDVVVSWAP